MSALDDYFAALDRLKKKKPIRVASGLKITNDAVALEAGRVKGSIKKSRPGFASLIKAIDEAGTAMAAPAERERQRFDKNKGTVLDYRRKLEAALARELSLLREVYSLRKEVASVTQTKVIPIRGP